MLGLNEGEGSAAFYKALLWMVSRGDGLARGAWDPVSDFGCDVRSGGPAGNARVERTDPGAGHRSRRGSAGGLRYRSTRCVLEKTGKLARIVNDKSGVSTSLLSARPRLPEWLRLKLPTSGGFTATRN